MCLQCRRPGVDPWVRKSAWTRQWQPLQDSRLENPMDTGAWQATVHRATNSRTSLTNTHTQRKPHRAPLPWHRVRTGQACGTEARPPLGSMALWSQTSGSRSMAKELRLCSCLTTALSGPRQGSLMPPRRQRNLRMISRQVIWLPHACSTKKLK